MADGSVWLYMKWKQLDAYLFDFGSFLASLIDFLSKALIIVVFFGDVL